MVQNPRAAPGPGALRALNLPVRISVEADARQKPVALTLRGCRLKVAFIDDQWEIEDEWWRPKPISRMYYLVTTEDQRQITLFHDLVDGGWYRQGVSP